MSSSSGPDEPGTPRLDAAELEELEEQAPEEKALGTRAAGGGAERRGWPETRRGPVPP